MSFTEYLQYDAIGLADLIARKQISSTDALEAAITQIEKCNPKVNAVINKLYEKARTATQKPMTGPFAGVPFLLKDLSAAYAGEIYNCGSRYLNDYVPNYEDEMVTRLKKTGVILLGKTNTPEFGLSYHTDPVAFGNTSTPWNLAYNSGGSSGGSAAAVACGMVPVAHASDGGGSIRVPASCCGIFGIKPSRGRMPSGPVVGKAWQGLSISHVVSRSVRDSAAFLDVLQGADLGAPFNVEPPPHSFLSCLDKPINKLRIALVSTPLFATHQPTHPDCLAAVRKTAKLCENLGHHVEEIPFTFDESKVAQAITALIGGETAAMLSSFETLLKRKPKTGELELTTRLWNMLGQRFTAADFALATYVMDDLTRHMARFFVNYDVLLTPTLQGLPARHGQYRLKPFEKNIITMGVRFPFGPMVDAVVAKVREKMFEFSANTTLFNITGCPAMSVPLYWNQDNLPIGSQFAAKIGAEATLLQLAAQLEQAEPWAGNLLQLQKDF